VSRPTFQSIYMRLAFMLAERSTCSRLQVGCVITSNDYRYVYGVGYNGNAAGLPNRCDRTTPGDCGDLHAEENAIINCSTPRYVPKVVFVTDIPCPMCAKRLINLGGVERLYYAREYRIRDSLQTLQDMGIDVFCEEVS